jgi:hypothetical protein
VQSEVQEEHVHLEKCNWKMNFALKMRIVVEASRILLKPNKQLGEAIQETADCGTFEVQTEMQLRLVVRLRCTWMRN